MSFIFKLLDGEFNFIIPISYMIIGVMVAVLIFAIRYGVYKKRKKLYAKLKESAEQQNDVRKEVKQID
jgi:uncharacterized membrane-anchored protein YhcB (DUF1043 family)